MAQSKKPQPKAHEPLERVLAILKSLNGEHDEVRRDMMFFERVLCNVYFKPNPHDSAISLIVYKDSTFKVGGSSCIPRGEFFAYAEAYKRSLSFVQSMELKEAPVK